MSDPDDMAYATITDPVFFIDNNTLDVLPAGGSCSYSAVAYPSVAYNASSITAFPNRLTPESFGSKQPPAKGV